MTPAKQGRRGGSRLDGHEDFIVGMIKEAKDVTLNGMVLPWLKTRQFALAAVLSMSGCASAVGLSKKTAHALEQERPDLLKRRQDWFEGQLDLDPARLVFIDETGLRTKMSRLRGQSLCGERCRSAVPHGHWKTTTFTGALRLSGMTAPMVLDGAMNGIVFRAFVEQVLVPTLTPGEIIVMDNLLAHRADGVRQAIESAECQLLYLPPNSPDFNPIERPFQCSRPSCEPEQSAPSKHSGIRSATIVALFTFIPRVYQSLQGMWI